MSWTVWGLVCSFRDKGLVLDKDDVIQVKEAFKWIMQGLVIKQFKDVAVVSKVGDIKSWKTPPMEIKGGVYPNKKRVIRG